MATRLSLRRVGGSTGKLISAPDSVASRWPSTPPSSGVVVVALGLDIADRGENHRTRVRGTPYQPTNSLRTRVRPRHDQPTNSVG